MFESLITITKPAGADDDSDLVFPGGTIYKGIVKSANFITGGALAQAIGLTDGMQHNDAAGWLHFIEADGTELYISKKTLRYGLTYQSIDAAQAGNSKEVTIGGEVYIVRFINGNEAATKFAYQRYMLPLIDPPKRNSYPADPVVPTWGYYTPLMMGNNEPDYSQPGSQTMCAEAYGGGWLTRGYPNFASVWYQDNLTPQLYHGWRPLLIKKSSLPVSAYKGLVNQDNFITFAALATELGVTEGTPSNGTVEWLHFAEEGKEVYIPRMGIRHTISWEQLSARNLITGNRTIVIGGQTFKVRLMTGCEQDPGIAGGGLAAREWKKYIVGLTDGTYDSQTAAWAGVGNDGINISILQEASANETGAHSGAGYPGINDIWYVSANQEHPFFNWRPLLEKV